MTDYENDLRAGEEYHHVYDLDPEEMSAIEILSGTYYYSENWETERRDDADISKRLQLAIFLENAVQYAARQGFDERDLHSFADLASFAEYLLDAMSLMAKVHKDRLEALVLASFMAKLTLDETIYRGKSAQEVWLENFQRASAIHDRCLLERSHDN